MPIPATRPHPLANGLLPPLLGLAAALITAASMLWLLRPAAVAILADHLAARIVGYVAATLAAAGGVAAVAFLVQPASNRKATAQVALQVAAAGVWIAPAVLLTDRGSALTFFAGAGLALASATCIRVFYTPARKGRNRREPGFGRAAAGITLCLHAAALGILTANQELSLAAVGVAIFAITWKVAQVRSGLGAPELGVGSLIAVLLIFQPLGPKDGSFGRLGGAPVDANGTPAKAEDRSKLHSGIILEPEHQRVTLLAPVPRLLHGRQAVPREAKPFSIPFSGQYWFYYSRTRQVNGRWVAMRSQPPDDSLFERGNPLTWTFTAMNRALPLTMKAHQKLEAPIQLSCCSLIKVLVEDVDTEAGEIALELILLDSGTPGSFLSLGEQKVTNKPSKSVVHFAVPVQPGLHEFDGMEVIFHRPRNRSGKGANVAIERFDLVPKGR